MNWGLIQFAGQLLDAFIMWSWRTAVLALRIVVWGLVRLVDVYLFLAALTCRHLGYRRAWDRLIWVKVRWLRLTGRDLYPHPDDSVDDPVRRAEQAWLARWDRPR